MLSRIPNINRTPNPIIPNTPNSQLNESRSITIKITANWIENIISEELPCHITIELHWLENKFFSSFGEYYAQWVNSGCKFNQYSYEISNLLSLGMKPGIATGIGFQKIATDEQSAALSGDSFTIEEVNNDRLFYVQ